MGASPEVLEKVALIDVEEKAPLLKDDIEAQVAKAEDVKVELSTSAGPEDANPEGTTAPLKKKEYKRIHALDNLRAVLIFLLILQHATLETVAHVPDLSDAKYQKQSLFLTLFVTLTRHTVVSLLFFVSGLASAYNMVVHKRDWVPLYFIFGKAWRTIFFAASYVYVIPSLQLIYGPWPKNNGKAHSFFASREGHNWILSGPIAYVLLLFIFDLFYAIARTVNLHFKLYTNVITTKTRYNIAKYTALVLLQFWTTFAATGHLRPPSFLLPFVSIFHPLSESPVQYIFAYLAGLHFVSIYKFLLAETPPRMSHTVISVRLFLASSTLFAMYRRFPVQMQELSSLTSAPHYAISVTTNSPYDMYPGLFYGAWSTLIFILLPPIIIQLFFLKKDLRKDWGIISRVAFLQPFFHMFFVMGFARKATLFVSNEHLILKCVFVGFMSAVVGWAATIAPYLVYRWLLRTVLMKIMVVLLMIIMVPTAIITAFSLVVAERLGIPTPEWYNRPPDVLEEVSSSEAADIGQTALVHVEPSAVPEAVYAGAVAL